MHARLNSSDHHTTVDAVMASDIESGAVILTIEADQLAADPCGISHPERVMGQQWPSFESN